MKIQTVSRIWIDRDSMGHSIAWAVDNLPGLCARQPKPGSQWQFDLILDNIAIVTKGWDWWVTTNQLLTMEFKTPGSTSMERFPQEIVPAVELFRRLHNQKFQTRREALQALDGLLLSV